MIAEPARVKRSGTSSKKAMPPPIENRRRILPTERIAGFDHARLAAGFTHVLEQRPMDVGSTGVFGFLFVETPEEKRGELGHEQLG